MVVVAAVIFDSFARQNSPSVHKLLINKCFATLNECAHKERTRKREADN